MPQLGELGIFTMELRQATASAAADAAAELEALGYSALWLPGGPDGGGVMERLQGLLAATERVVVGPAVYNVWIGEPWQVAAQHAKLSAAYPGRVVLAVGASHANFVERRGLSYARPRQAVSDFLDGLAAADPPVPRSQLLLAALGPRMMEMARDRTAGCLPYLFTPRHTAWARGVLGKGPQLVVELAVTLHTDGGRAREAGREYLSRYLSRPNYTNNLLRQGFEERDFAAGGSDRLIDAVLAWGGLDAIAQRILEHREAGADHVCIQVFNTDPQLLPMHAWRELASLTSL